MKQTPLEKRITEIVEPAVKDLGFDLYCVRETSDAGVMIIQIMAEEEKTKKLGIEDCAKISRAVAALMDVEDPISSKYRLEVSSPGIDRFLLRAEHYETYKGFEAKVESDVLNENGQKRFRGTIEDIRDNIVLLKTDQGDIEIPIGSVAKAKLVMNDELIQRTANM